MSQTLRDDGTPNPSANPFLTELVDRAIAANPSRRRLLLGGPGAAALPSLGGLSGCGGGSNTAAPPPAPTPERLFGFSAVATSTGDDIVVPAGYVASARRADGSGSALEQEQQVGMAFLGFDSAGRAFGERCVEGLLVINHEYANLEYFHAPGDDADGLATFTHGKARQAQAARGLSVAHVKRAADGQWRHVRDSIYNRRIHGNTPLAIQGPAAGHALMRTAADPLGR